MRDKKKGGEADKEWGDAGGGVSDRDTGRAVKHRGKKEESAD